SRSASSPIRLRTIGESPSASATPVAVRSRARASIAGLSTTGPSRGSSKVAAARLSSSPTASSAPTSRARASNPRAAPLARRPRPWAAAQRRQVLAAPRDRGAQRLRLGAGPSPRLQRRAQARRTGAEVLHRGTAPDAGEDRDEDDEVEGRPEKLADRRLMRRVLVH